MENPFKFGTIVEEYLFSYRENKVTHITQFAKCANR